MKDNGRRALPGAGGSGVVPAERKRTEIAKIELKQRVAVLMVPNKTLETPNYRLERLSTTTRAWTTSASCKLADEVEDPPP